MGAGENELIRRRLATLRPNERRFRINAGVGWIASSKDTLVVRSRKRNLARFIRVFDGDVVLRHPRRFHGAPAGWLDLAGWDEIEISPDMVGKTVAVFAMDEFKTGRQRLSAVQKLFQAVLLRMGGRVRVIRETGPRPDPDATAETLPPVPSTRRR